MGRGIISRGHHDSSWRRKVQGQGQRKNTQQSYPHIMTIPALVEANGRLHGHRTVPRALKLGHRRRATTGRHAVFLERQHLHIAKPHAPRAITALRGGAGNQAKQSECDRDRGKQGERRGTPPSPL